MVLPLQRPASTTASKASPATSTTTSSTSLNSSLSSSTNSSTSLLEEADALEERRLSGDDASVSGGSGAVGGSGLEVDLFGALALRYAVALSAASTHPVSRAMTELGSRMPRGATSNDVLVSDFEQVCADARLCVDTG